MSDVIREMIEADRELYMRLVDDFYHSPAVLHPATQEIYERCFAAAIAPGEECVGYIFEFEGEPAGYAVTCRQFCTEVGGMSLWIEELFVDEKYRSKGLGAEFFAFLREKYGDELRRVRLEVEPDNLRAMKFYERMGFKPLGYSQMVIDRP